MKWIDVKVKTPDRNQSKEDRAGNVVALKSVVLLRDMEEQSKGTVKYSRFLSLNPCLALGSISG